MDTGRQVVTVEAPNTVAVQTAAVTEVHRVDHPAATAEVTKPAVAEVMNLVAAEVMNPVVAADTADRRVDHLATAEVLNRAAAVTNQVVTDAANPAAMVAVNRKVATAEDRVTGPVAKAAKVVLPAVTISLVTTEVTGPVATNAAMNLHNVTTIQPAPAPARVTTNVADAAVDAA